LKKVKQNKKPRKCEKCQYGSIIPSACEPLDLIFYCSEPRCKKIEEDVRNGLAQLTRIKTHFATAPGMSVTDRYGNEMYSNGEVDRWLENGSRILGMKGIQRGY
jgi:hypothetical protein